MPKNYYQIFNIDTDATIDEISQAYEALLDRYRIRLGEEDFKEKSAALEKAYRILADEKSRAKYDKTLFEGKTAEKNAFFSTSVKPEPKMQSETNSNKLYTEKYEDAKPYASEPEKADSNYKRAKYDEEGQPVEKPKIKGLIIAIAVVFLLIAGGAYYFYNYMYIPDSNYKKAISQAEQKKYQSALTNFEKLGNYKDAKERALNVKRSMGYDYINKKKFDQALKIFTEVNNPDDIKNCKTAQADYLLSQKKYDQAISIYTELNDTEGVNNAKYVNASNLLSAGDQAGAYKIFSTIGDYKDAAGQAMALKAAVQTQAVADLNAVSEVKMSFYSFEDAKSCVIKLAKADQAAKDFDLTGLTEQIKKKWDAVNGTYFGKYYTGVASKNNTYNKEYFSTVGTTATASTSGAPGEATSKFSVNPEYVSLYAKCLPDASKKTLSVIWYKYDLNTATGEFEERNQVAASKAVALPAIKNAYTVNFATKRNSFTFGAGLYAAEITAKGENEPCAVRFFYLQ